MASWIITIPYHFKTHDMSIEAVRIEPFSLVYVPDHFKTQDMCTEAVIIEPFLLVCVPDHFKHKACAIRLCATCHARCYLFLINI